MLTDKEKAYEAARLANEAIDEFAQPGSCKISDTENKLLRIKDIIKSLQKSDNIIIEHINGLLYACKHPWEFNEQRIAGNLLAILEDCNKLLKAL